MGDPACWMHLLDDEGRIPEPPPPQLDLVAPDRERPEPASGQRGERARRRTAASPAKSRRRPSEGRP